MHLRQIPQLQTNVSCNLQHVFIQSEIVRRLKQQSDLIERVVLITPPKEFREDGNTV